MKNKTYHISKIQIKYRRNRSKIGGPNINAFVYRSDLSLSLLGTGTSMKSGGLSWFYGPKHPLLVK